MIFFSLSFRDSGVSRGDLTGLGGVVLNTGVGFTLGVVLGKLFGLELKTGDNADVTIAAGATLGVLVTVAVDVAGVLVLGTVASWLLFLNCGIGGTVYFCFGIFGGSLIVLSALAWSLFSNFSMKFSVDGFGELNCFVNG